MSILSASRPATKPIRRREPGPLNASLTIAIRLDVYGLHRISPGEDGTSAWRLEKQGDGDAVYDAIRLHSGELQCSCPDWTVRSQDQCGYRCKHLQALQTVGLLEAPELLPNWAEVAPLPDPRDAYNDAREKLAAIELAEEQVRGEGEVKRHIVTLDHPARVAPAFDAQLYVCQNAVAERRALWLSHRHLHTSDPLPAPAKGICGTYTPAESRHDEALPACCPLDEPMPCQGCLAGEGPGDLADDGWDDSATWEITPDDEPEARTLADQIDVEAARYRTLGTDFGDLLAETIAKLAAEVRWLDASTPAGYRDRRDAALDCAALEAEARIAARC